MLKFSSSEYPKEIRVEAAYFIGQMFYSSLTTLQILISSGGFEALSEFLDFNYIENKDLICLSIDCLRIIFDLKLLSSPNLCKILTKYHILHRLVLVIDQINLDEEDIVNKKFFSLFFIVFNFFFFLEYEKISRKGPLSLN